MSFAARGCKHDPNRICNSCIQDLDARLSKLEMQKFGESYSMFHSQQQPIVWPTAPRATSPNIVLVLRDTSPKRRISVVKPKVAKKPQTKGKAKTAKAKAGGKTPKTKTEHVKGESRGRPWEVAGPKPKKTKAKKVQTGQTLKVKPEHKS